MSRPATIVVLSLAALLGACRGQPSADPPIVPIRNMYDQPKYSPQLASPFFADGRSMRPLVEGTVAFEMEANPAIDSGRQIDDSEWLPEDPREVIARNGGHEKLVLRGQGRFDIYCAPCHGVAGDGQGMVSERAVSVGAAALKAADLHDSRLKHIPDGQLYATITNGVRNMPAYRHSVPIDDRWAIVSYVRALQLASDGGATAMNTAEEATP
ncbi:MAG: cytochrome c [Myxococcales bacterium]|nr:cytochrome c [Myxococcales bacterium]